MTKRATYASIVETSLIWLVILGVLYLTSLYSYLLFHSIIEIFTIAVAVTTFMIAWNARQMMDNNYLLFLGIAYLFVAFIDLAHTLTYGGMGVFADQTSNLPTQLWVAGRYVQSISLLIAPLFLKRKLRINLSLVTFSLIDILLLLSIFVWDIFPNAYLPATGLTVFKKISEVVVIVFLLGSIAILVRTRKAFAPEVLRTLVLSIATLVLSEVCFTSYASVYSFFNLLGHMFRLVAYYLFYKAIIETGLERPYQLLFWNLKRNENALLAQTEELQERNEELDAFAHTVAHDLQNPLSAIALASRAAQREDMPAQDREEFLEEIASTAYKMSEIIESLMLLAETRTRDVPGECLDMKVIIESVTRRMSRQISASKAMVYLPDEWPVAIGYGPWIEEVWSNYLSNALKYGGRPPRIELGADEPIGGHVRFWVKDYGQGLSPEEQARLFQPFTRLRNISGGHGLGLSIVKRVVERLGGQVGVESTPGKGSVFFFTLPTHERMEIGEMAAALRPI